MNLKTLILVIGFISVVSGCYSRSKNRNLHDTQQTENPLNIAVMSESSPLGNTDDSSDIALNVLELSRELTRRKLASSVNSKYEVLSPISITSALQLAFLAAKGETYEELRKLLNYSSDYKAITEIHREFGRIIEDLQTNIANPQREIVNWRKDTRDGYVQKYMRGQSNFTNYEEHKIEMANGIFVRKGITLREQYKNVVIDIYKSDIKTLDFKHYPEASAKSINDWVKKKTHDKIEMIVPRVMDPNTQAVLVNALYFNAQWQTNFINGATMSKDFYPNGKNGESIKVDLMAHGGKFPHYHDPETNSDILGFPYKQNSTTMYVILPQESNRQRLLDVQATLTAEKIDKMIDNMTLKTAVVLFPKMHLSSSHYLKPDLQEMGVRQLFNEVSSDLSLLADAFTSSRRSFHKRNKRNVSYKTPSEDKDKEYQLNFKDFLLKKRIVKNAVGDKKKTHRRSKRDIIDDLESLRREQSYTNNPGLFADEVIHKVDLNINEKGTEGGAATAITLNRSGSQVVFRVDVPFLFLIRHDPTRIPLFYGAVFEPPQSN